MSERLERLDSPAPPSDASPQSSGNAQLIESFYRAFARRDADAMAACYHPQATFSDPAFPHLEGSEIGAMWRMLCERGKDLELTFEDVEAHGDRASARWRALYTFSATGRKVDNRIAASFELEDGLIRRHQDRFDFYRWTRMALGPAGWLLGWTPFLQNKVRAQAAGQLAKYQQKRLEKLEAQPAEG